MELRLISGGKDDRRSSAELLDNLGSSREGLSALEALDRLTSHGPNAIEVDRGNPWSWLARGLGGPLSWGMEGVACMSMVLGRWLDLLVVVALLLLRVLVGFWREMVVAEAMGALGRQLSPEARVMRDGRWQVLPSWNLVLGDIISLRQGDIIPADVKLIEGGHLSVDQSSLTGEPLAVRLGLEDLAYGGSVVKEGEMVALVTATVTPQGRAKAMGRGGTLQRDILTLGDYLSYMALALGATLLLVLLVRGESLVVALPYAIILGVAMLFEALPGVLVGTMAQGALAMGRRKAIVSRLQSIEEVAALDTLCIDKTGTLTQDRPTLAEAVAAAPGEEERVILSAALASREVMPDSVDQAIRAGLSGPEALDPYETMTLIPFDPLTKRAEAVVRDSQGRTFRVTKGAPEVILGLCELSDQDRASMNHAVGEMAKKCCRVIAVARAEMGGPWRLVGLLPLFDPLREEGVTMIQRAEALGLGVKMVTGDNMALAREIATLVGLGRDILPGDEVFPRGAKLVLVSPEAAELIEEADGFAQVFPEHRHLITRALQERGHRVAMAARGVEDVPALRRAEVGMAPFGASGAAQAAANLVLAAPGLPVVVGAVEEARRIMERLSAGAIYRLAEAMRVMLFVLVALAAFGFYPLTLPMIILLSLIIHLPFLALNHDRGEVEGRPVRWGVARVLLMAVLMGLLGVAEAMGLALVGLKALHLPQEGLPSLLFLGLALAGPLTLPLLRTRGFFLGRPFPSVTMLLAVGAALAGATVAAGLGLVMSPLPWPLVALAWAYSLIWMFIKDQAKIHVLHHLSLGGERHRRLFEHFQRPLHPHGGGYGDP